MITVILSVHENKIFFKNKMLRLTDASLQRLLRLENNANIVRVSREFDKFNRLVVSFIPINDPMLQAIRKEIECTSQKIMDLTVSS